MGTRLVKSHVLGPGVGEEKYWIVFEAGLRDERDVLELTVHLFKASMSTIRVEPGTVGHIRIEDDRVVVEDDGSPSIVVEEDSRRGHVGSRAYDSVVVNSSYPRSSYIRQIPEACFAHYHTCAWIFHLLHNNLVWF